MAHSVSSDRQIGEGDSCARNPELLEGLSQEQHANEFNSSQKKTRKTRIQNRNRKV